MRHGKLLVIIVIMLAVAGIVFLDKTPPSEQRKSSIAIALQEGVSVSGPNPAVVEPGEPVSFQVTIDDKYEFVSASDGVYHDGTLTVSDTHLSKTVYIDTLKYCDVSFSVSDHGSAEMISGNVALQGDMASLLLVPEENYVIGSIDVNGIPHPVPSGDTFSFSVQDDSLINVEFCGKELNFLTVSNNLGFIRVDGGSEVYRYGDTIRLSCDYDAGQIKFGGWSLGNYLSEKGELVSKEPECEFQLLEDTTLYANFSDKSSYVLSYDDNGGKLKKKLEREYSPGAYVNIALSDGTFTRKGYTLIGFSTEADGSSGILAPGAMIEIPRHDITLYAQWVKNTDTDYLDYRTSDGKITICGFSEEGVRAEITELVIPEQINGKDVAIIDKSAFENCRTLQTVVLPVGLSEIMEKSFSGCSGLSTVYFPETLKALDASAFENCDSFENMRVLASLARAFDYDYNAALAQKYMRLKNTEGKRIIFVAGSSLAFGLNSSMVQESFPEYEIINMGVSRYYGIMPHFDMLRANVREGDIVVFCPEYFESMYAASEATSNMNWLYLESNYDILKDISLKNNSLLLHYYADYLATKRSYLPGKKTNDIPAYSTAAFNRFGDVTSVRFSTHDYKLSLPDPGIITDEGMARYNDVCRYLTERGATCLFSYPSLTSGDVPKEEIRSSTADFVSKLRSGLDSEYCPIISDICDYYYDNGVFYDTLYHLTLEGADMRTEKLIADMKAYLED